MGKTDFSKVGEAIAATRQYFVERGDRVSVAKIDKCFKPNKKPKKPKGKA